MECFHHDWHECFRSKPIGGVLVIFLVHTIPVEYWGRHPEVPSHHSTSTQRPEACAQIVNDRLRLLPCGEVPAFRMTVVEQKIGIGALCPTPRGFSDLLRESADDSRDGDAQVVDEPALELRI